MSDRINWLERVIPQGRLESVCKVGQGAATCRYVTGQALGICCVKKVQSLKDHLDQRAATGSITARGDNCSGLPLN